ncbi:uncharacterized protein LOC120177716 [Hibiscus syriacus]|uniref:uncharacterized protein LOC120177716 n=1 Tax=Hibiscus syriacus TaxID=106335 RepID=UPI001920E889|nr:uncharacterized protein LOC120177716 [Hibiscus syriacus]
MGSSSTQIEHHQKAAKECGDPIVPATKYPSFSSSSSLSSSSSSLASSYFPDDSFLSPGTPFRFSGVPFSWKHLPGIPKKLQNHNQKCNSISCCHCRRRQSHGLQKTTVPKIRMRKKASTGASESFRRVDPFFAALVEC